MPQLSNQQYFGLFLGTVTTLMFLNYSRWLQQLKRKILQKRKKDGSVNIGAIFGMDIGGTLTKIVYFEANMEDISESSDSLVNSRNNSSDIALTTLVSSPGLKKNRSFVNLEEPQQKAALRELYEYMDLEKEMTIRDDMLTFHSHILGGKIHFLHFETRNIMEAINYLSSTAITENIRTIGCTGGGGHKYAKQFAEQLEIKVVPLDELGCLVRGMDFTLTNVSNECYTYRRNSQSSKTKTKPLQKMMEVSEGIEKTEEKTEVTTAEAEVATTITIEEKMETSEDLKWQKDVKEDMSVVILPKELFVSKGIFPYMVVNIGSGVSILKITSPGKFERVSGSSLGGGTYWGLCRLLTSASSYEKVLDLAETGNAAEVDMLVKDIYGGSYDQMNLNASMVASSFGKLVMKTNPREGVKEEDLAIALLMMITNNIGQVAYLNAQLYHCSKIFFVGSFLRHNSISCRRLAFAIDFWSNGKMEALFLKHEGYFGALGTFLQSAFENDLDSILDLGHKSDSNEEGSGNNNSNRSSSRNSPTFNSRQRYSPIVRQSRSQPMGIGNLDAHIRRLSNSNRNNNSENTNNINNNSSSSSNSNSNSNSNEQNNDMPSANSSERDRDKYEEKDSYRDISLNQTWSSDQQQQQQRRYRSFSNDAITSKNMTTYMNSINPMAGPYNNPHPNSNPNPNINSNTTSQNNSSSS